MMDDGKLRFCLATRPAYPAAWVALALAISVCGCRGDQDASAPGPRAAQDPKTLPMKHPGCNLILVSFDALQGAHVGSLGYERNVTPTMDAIAAEGFNFTRHHSVASWTVPASMTWFTGVYPSEHRMTNKFAVYSPTEKKLAMLQDLAPELATLAGILQQRGYATGGFTGNAGVSGGFGYSTGFEVYYHDSERFGTFDQSIPRALAWLRENKDRQFFLFLHGYDIHGQSMPAEGFDYRFVDPRYDQKYTGSPQEQEALREEGLERGSLTLRESDVHFWRAIYDEKIQRADAKFKDFVGELDKLGLTGNTLLVLTSDHGTEFYEHRRFDHGFTLYQEQIHVPLIIRLPSQHSGMRVDDQVSSIDLLPTILDLLAVDVSDDEKSQLRGNSLVPAMQGKKVERDVISETDYRQYTYKRSIISPTGWKLIYTLEDRSRELFDLRRDPGETQNLADSETQIAADLEARLFEHYRAIGHDLRSQRWERGLNPVYPSQGKESP